MRLYSSYLPLSLSFYIYINLHISIPLFTISGEFTHEIWHEVTITLRRWQKKTKIFTTVYIYIYIYRNRGTAVYMTCFSQDLTCIDTPSLWIGRINAAISTIKRHNKDVTINGGHDTKHERREGWRSESERSDIVIWRGATQPQRRIYAKQGRGGRRRVGEVRYIFLRLRISRAKTDTIVILIITSNFVVERQSNSWIDR